MIWIKVEDKLPDCFVPVLVTDGKSVLVGERQGDRYSERGWCWDQVGCDSPDESIEWDFSRHVDPITHWMPMPAVPGVENAR